MDDFYTFIHRETTQEKITYVVEPKFDGVSVEVVYEKGKLKYGATRGDGFVGEEITHNIKTIPTLLLRLQQKNPPPFLAIEGEALLPKAGFQKLNRERITNPPIRLLSNRKYKNLALII